jgi:hypothetical protein
MQNFDHNIGFWEKRQFFGQKLSKIAKKCFYDSRSQSYDRDLQRQRCKFLQRHG